MEDVLRNTESERKWALIKPVAQGIKRFWRAGGALLVDHPEYQCVTTDDNTAGD